MLENDYCHVCMLPNVEKQFHIRAVRDGGRALSDPFGQDSTAVFLYQRASHSFNIPSLTRRVLCRYESVQYLQPCWELVTGYA